MLQIVRIFSSLVEIGSFGAGEEAALIASFMAMLVGDTTATHGAEFLFELVKQLAREIGGEGFIIDHQAKSEYSTGKSTASTLIESATDATTETGGGSLEHELRYLDGVKLSVQGHSGGL